MWKSLSSMMLSLSASEPTVSATGASARLLDGGQHRLVDALDEVVALLVEAVDGAFGGGDLVIVVGARFVLLVPELDVGLRQACDERADALGHARIAVGSERAANVRHPCRKRHAAVCPAPRAAANFAAVPGPIRPIAPRPCRWFRSPRPRRC